MGATYSCANCGMAANASSANCNEPLVNGVLQLDGGGWVQISQCPKCQGKTPMCCGSDMSCAV